MAPRVDKVWELERIWAQALDRERKGGGGGFTVGATRSSGYEYILDTGVGKRRRNELSE